MDATSPQWKAAVARMMGQQNFPAPQPSELGHPFQQTNWQGVNYLHQLLGLIPQYSGSQGSGVPPWMMQVNAQEPAATNAAATPTPNAWGDIEEQASHEQAIADQLGGFSDKVLHSDYFMGTTNK